MKKLQFIVVLMAYTIYSVGQNNTVNTNVTAQQLANHILGFGVDLISASYSGNSVSKGIIKTNAIPQMTEGIILSTGQVNTEIFNPPSNFNSHSLNNAGDGDLLSLYNSVGYDAASLEVVIRPRGNKLTFQYIFASEEYPGYVCQANDMFALLIKPNNAAATYTNIALVPGTNYPISINTIHGYSTPCSGYPQSYNQYYNVPSSTDSFVFNGRTVLLTAEYTVIPCQLYKLKFVIHDMMDGGYNSAIYIKANSLNSTGVTLNNNQSNAINGINQLIKNCQSDTIKFNRNNGITGDLDVIIAKSGTAVAGVDYLPIVDSFKLLNTAQQYTIPVVPIGNNTTDKNLLLKFYRKLPNCNGGTELIYIDSILYHFKSIPKPNGLNNVTLCNTGNYQLSVSNTYGFDSIRFTPNVGLSSYNTFNPIFTSNTSQTYYVTLYKNGCNRIDTLTLTRLTTTTNYINDSVCASNLPYNWMGRSVNSIGTHTLIDTSVTSQGCDSITILNLKVFNNPINPTLAQTICQESLPFTWNGQTINTIGTHTLTFTNRSTISNCDSTTTLNLVVNPSLSNNLTQHICQQNLPFNWNGISINTVGTHTINFTSPSLVTGCDSTTTLTLIVNPNKLHTIKDTVCQSALPYNWNGLVVNSTGNQTLNYTTPSLLTGCDSTTTLNLFILQTPVVIPINNQIFCNGSPTSIINFVALSAGATITYNWTNNNTAIGLPANGSGNIASFVPTNNTNAPITATITVTPTAKLGNYTCTGTPMVFTITVNPTSTVNTIANQSLCAGANTTAINFSSPNTGGTIVYNWTNNYTNIGLAASGTGNIPSFAATNTTNGPITATITVTPSYTSNSVTCIGTARTFTITVNPSATVATINNQILCAGANTTAINFSSPTTSGTIVYNWTNNNTAIGLAANGTGNITSFIATNTTNAPITASITVTPSYTANSVTCTGTPRTFTITVNPTPTVSAITNQNLCAGAATTAINFSSPTTGGTITYNWINTNTAIGLAASGTGNIPSFTATNTTTTPITATITVTPSYTANGVTCSGTPRTFTITVNPTATVAAINNQSLCVGALSNAINFSSPTTAGTIVYNWTNNNTAIGLAASGTGNINPFTASNTTNAPITSTITVTPSYTANGVTCTGTPRTFTITVNPIASVNSINNQNLCAGANNTAINFGSPTTGGTIVYNWTNSNTAIGLAATGNGNIASFQATNNTNAPITATITVTPTYTANGITCTGTPRLFSITVNPTATINSINNQNVCVGDWMPGVNFSSPTTGGTIVYNWTNSNTAIGLAASGTGNIPSFIATSNIGNAPISGTITVTPTYTVNNITCTGTPMIFTINVNPYPEVDLGEDIVRCINQGELEFLNARNPGANYLWDNNYNGQVRVLDQSGQYWVAVTNQWGCTSTDSIQVSLNLNPKVELGNDTSVCIGTNMTLDAGNDGISYIWSTGATTPTTQATQPGLYKVAVTAANGCIQTDSITIEHEGRYPKYDGIWARNIDRYTFKFQLIDPTYVTSYAWDFGDGSRLSYEAEPVHTFPTTGNYIVRLHVLSSCGGIQDTTTVHILSHTDIEDLDTDKYKVTIYPVPAQDNVNIIADKNVLIQKIMLTNQLGQLVKVVSIDKPTTEVNISLEEIAAANYNVRIITNKGVLNKIITVVK